MTDRGRPGAPDQDALFVYGTLMPGHLRWWMLAPHAVAHRPAVVPGTLYDTGDGWPAAAFGTASGRTVPGWVVWFDAAVLAGLLPELDRMEGIGPVPDRRNDPYVRIRVPIDSVTEAWGYHATTMHSSWRPIDAWLDQPEA
ncbi:gamma-glutamylcyclotransferase family protein [Aquihabitans sp. McL0605]|uniref:gamma-glutamylcyclotransferase family protein n=1 Tax=Aquihabitans sp. McL0605 TaxID=3415671 RepID=UPI003CF0DC34